MMSRGRLKKFACVRSWMMWTMLPAVAASLSLVGCAGSPPPAGAGPAAAGTSGDAINVSDICSQAAQTRVAAAASPDSIKTICSLKDSVADASRNFFYDTAGADYSPYYGDARGEEVLRTTEGSNKVYGFSIYTGVLAKGQKPADVVDVIRLQLFYPTEFKNGGFKTDSLVTYTPKGVTPGNFSNIEYDYYKNAVGNERPKLDYSSKVTIYDFGAAGLVVVDKLTAERNGSGLKNVEGVLLVYPKNGDTYVVGRSYQVVRAQNQTYDQVKSGVNATMKEQVQRDFDNYANATKAAQVMAGKKK